jgi:hypothetical protein
MRKYQVKNLILNNVKGKIHQDPDLSIFNARSIIYQSFQIKKIIFSRSQVSIW